MMVRNLLHEIVRRGLWPIPVVAIAVALAAPLLFLRSAPEEAPPSAAVVPAAQADLPARAQRLLTTTDASATKGRRLPRSARDPFSAPASESGGAGDKKSPSKKKAATKPSSGTTPPDAAPVIVKNPRGSTTVPSAPAATPKAGDGGTSTPRSSESSSTPTFDVRFGARKDDPIQRRIPRLKTFEVRGKIAVVFVKYSPTRHKAVFAIDPSTTVGGDVDCRRVHGLCRYVDIPAGKYARLTFVNDDGSRVSRRLDVVRIHERV